MSRPRRVTLTALRRQKGGKEVVHENPRLCGNLHMSEKRVPIELALRLRTSGRVLVVLLLLTTLLVIDRPLSQTGLIAREINPRCSSTPALNLKCLTIAPAPPLNPCPPRLPCYSLCIYAVKYAGSVPSTLLAHCRRGRLCPYFPPSFFKLP